MNLFSNFFPTVTATVFVRIDCFEMSLAHILSFREDAIYCAACLARGPEKDGAPGPGYFIPKGWSSFKLDPRKQIDEQRDAFVMCDKCTALIGAGNFTQEWPRDFEGKDDRSDERSKGAG